MVKCVVTGCPNRVANSNRGMFNRPPKRFFNFPKDPARVKVWLAALRETDKQDSTEEHLICEDHFLPEDICNKGVNSDAIPIMPPCLDGSLDMITAWGAESEDEEEEEDQEEEEEEEVQWTSGMDVGKETAINDVGGNDVHAAVESPAPEPPPSEPPAVKQEPDENTFMEMTAGDDLHETTDASQIRKVASRQDVSLGLLTRRFLDLLLTSPDGTLDLREVTANLQTCKRRVYDVTNVLGGIRLIKKESANRIKWIGGSPISSFLWKNQEKFNGELENLKLVEDTLDTLIKSCAQQLFDMTDDMENSSLAYVTHEDVMRLGAFQEQTVIVVKAPEETKLEVPAPTEERIQVHLKGGKGPIMVLTCNISSGDVDGENSGCFVTLEESHIKTSLLHTGGSELCAGGKQWRPLKLFYVGNMATNPKLREFSRAQRFPAVSLLRSKKLGLEQKIVTFVKDVLKRFEWILSLDPSEAAKRQKEDRQVNSEEEQKT